jgi:hypothetical protein
MKMRSIILGTLMASGMVLVSIPGASAVQLGSGFRGAIVPDTTMQQVQGRRYCDDLRRACLNKGKLGERGEGNCQKYRTECKTFGYRSPERSEDRSPRRSRD